MISLREWTTVSPLAGSATRGVVLGDPRHRKVAAELSRSGRVIVRELREGLEIQSSSWVGRLDLGDVSIAITPKLAPETLLALFGYAYDLENLELYDAAPFSAGTMSLADLIVSQLEREASALLRRGLTRRYERREESLATPRGRLRLEELARGPLTKAELPCVHHERATDWPLNRVILAGLRFASSLAESAALRTRVSSTVRSWSDAVSIVPLHVERVRAVVGALDRQTERYRRALVLIEMLLESTSLGLEADSTEAPLPGFLFDMNLFFQELLAKFLREHLDDAEVHTQVQLRGLFQYARDANPLRRDPPVPKPDIEIRRGKEGGVFLDAKYRDLWEKPLGRDMLYQLSVYAVASSRRESAIIYPTANAAAREARIELREHGGGTRTIALRPLALSELRAAIGEQGAGAATVLARRLAYG